MKGTCKRRPNSRRWRSRVKLDGEWHSQEFGTKAEGEAWLATLIAEHSKGNPLDHLRKGKTPFGEVATNWLDHQRDEVAARTFKNIKGRVHNYIVPAFGDMRIAAIREEHVRAWRRDIAEGLANETVNKIVEHLNAIFRGAQPEYVTRNPVAKLKKLPKQSRRPIYPIAPDLVVALADAITPRYRAAILLMGLGTGMRPGEMWALRPGRLNLITGSIYVAESLAEDGGHLITTPPKTETSERSVSLDGEMISILREHIERFPSADFVFTSPEGCQVRPRNFLEDHFDRARASLRDVLPAGFRFYDLRHTHASLLIARGWRPDQVKDRLGHASIRTTLDLYSHLYPGHDEEHLVDLANVTRLALAGTDATKTRPIEGLAADA